MTPDLDSKVIAVARSLIGSHYINGGCGATPGASDGCPFRPGGIALIADPGRLNPNMVSPANRNLAVFAAEMFIKDYCICAGNYTSFPGGRTASPTDDDLVNYLATLKGQPTESWENFYEQYTPRRAFGPGPGGGLGGKLVWGQSCKGIRHFDCVGFIAFCWWKASGNALQLDISAWRRPDSSRTVYNLRTTTDDQGNDVAPNPPASLMSGDIIVKADHHIAFVDSNGAIFEAQDTDLGVRSTGHFSAGSPGEWTHLVRLGDAAEIPVPDWPYGWWKVWDGNTYYYYFGPDGIAKYIKTPPYNTRTAPPHANNVGRFTYTPNTLIVTWNKLAGVEEACRETFYNAAQGCQQMNANSNLYSPLVATRLS
jgi:hypothetical protein